MELILYPRLSTRSRRALVKTRKQFGHPYLYRPRYNLVERLSRETGMSIEQVYNQLQRERTYLISDLV